MFDNYTIETDLILTTITLNSKKNEFNVSFRHKDGKRSGCLSRAEGTPEKYAAKGGTRLYCPSCKCTRKCEVSNDKKSTNWYKVTHSDIQWFSRSRSCRTCFYTFNTAEVQEDFLNELVLLREDIINGATVTIDDLGSYGSNIIPFPGLDNSD